MTSADAVLRIVPALDEPTAVLVRLAGVIAVGGEQQVREALAAANRRGANALWIEELILQSYLFAGFPRTLNAMREWRRLSERSAPAATGGDDRAANGARWRAEGERTCAAVYGDMYERLRVNIAALHPALDEWMVVEGYGKVLSRPGLDLPRRELCIVAACAAAKQDRQLQSHLHGALNVGATPAQVAGALAAVADLMTDEEAARATAMLGRVVRGRNENGSV
jgi:4-carboxymuconolactone decarboxylase